MGYFIMIMSFVLAIVVVNKVQKLYMKLMGADMMFFNGKKKLIAILIVGLIIYGTILKVFGMA